MWIALTYFPSTEHFADIISTRPASRTKAAHLLQTHALTDCHHLTNVFRHAEWGPFCGRAPFGHCRDRSSNSAPKWLEHSPNGFLAYDRSFSSAVSGLSRPNYTFQINELSHRREVKPF